MRTSFEISETALDVAEVSARVANPAAGATALFVGSTRNSFSGKAVRHLEYEAYTALAERTFERIGTEVAGKWPDILGFAVAHRVGRVDVGEASIVVAVSSPHREAALAACAFAIDRLKALLPIWKLEVFEDGSSWRENSEWDSEGGGEPP